MRNGRIIRLDESQLKRIVAESVRGMLGEADWAGGTAWDPAAEHRAKKKAEKTGRNMDTIKTVVGALRGKLASNLAYMQYNLSFPTALNKMFIDKLPDGDEKDNMLKALELKKKMLEFYEFLYNFEDGL